MLVILQDVNTGQEESFPCEHGTLVVMSQLASGAAEQKYQHAITNSSGNLILVIEGYLLPGKSLKETFELIMNEYASAKGRMDVVDVREPFLLEDPSSKATIASAFSSNHEHAIAARGDVNWNKKENEHGLQLAITACGGLKHLKTGNVPTDENLLIVFLKRCNLPKTVSRHALMQQMRMKRRDSMASEIEEKESNQKQLNLFLDSRAEFDYKRASSLKELQKWVNDSQRTNLSEKFKGEVNNVDENKVHRQFLCDQVKARKKIAKAAAKNVSK